MPALLLLRLHAARPLSGWLWSPLRRRPPPVHLRTCSHATTTPDLDFQARLQAAVSPAACARLQQQGFVVLDGVLGPVACDALRGELHGLYAAGLMHRNHTHLVRDNATQLLPKAAIHEAELSLEPKVRAAAPLFGALDADRTLQTMLSLMLPQLQLDSHAVKLQYNEGGGGCFPMHFDSDEALDARRVTAIFYLNEGWRPGQGGELRLYPFPSPPVDVPPLSDRLVLFSSTRMLHRVLPSSAGRCCFTVWLSQRRARVAVRQPQKLAAPAAVPLAAAPGASEEQQLLEVVRFLMQPAVRQHVCKLVYAGEWHQSILESHPPSTQRDAALEVHQQEVDRIAAALARYSDVISALAQQAGAVHRQRQQQQQQTWMQRTLPRVLAQWGRGFAWL